jgi:hypothetical protein
VIPPFDRSFFGAPRRFSRIGGGALGGKATGLVRLDAALTAGLEGAWVGEIGVGIPRAVVVATDAFDAFLERNGLLEAVEGEPSDERLAHRFQRADLPPEIVGDLRALVEGVRRPLAVRSSSLLEDALEHPFAGVYETKMIPNDSPDPGARFQALVEAIKLVWASTFFESARAYRSAVRIGEGDEKMAVVIQEVVGRRHGGRFYPHVSAVGRSHSWYPVGSARPSDGVVHLALGLGRTIVDGGRCWAYSPAHPAAPPPFASTRGMLRETQTRFWAVRMGKAPAYDPIAEAEYLVEGDLKDAEWDGVLPALASTYDPDSDRLSPGTGRAGPRVLDFAPLLQLRQLPLNDALRAVMAVGEDELGTEVEMELAMTLPGPAGEGAHLGAVQLRPLVGLGEAVAVEPEELEAPDRLLASERAMGNGELRTVADIVYARPEAFSRAVTRRLAAEIGVWNRRLLEEGRPYLLLGFGRWGSSDPWLGIPVSWGQVSGAAVLVEAALPGMDVEPSQGSHFFHNLSSLGVVYLSVGLRASREIDWAWLESQPRVAETELLRHVRPSAPLLVRVDGRSGRGVVRRGPDAASPAGVGEGVS